MIWPGETEAGSAEGQPCEGSQSGRINALKIPTRKVEVLH